jgi:endonuclease/exonuclease/phosphatase family metal-dependent hydrolase
VGDFNDEPGGSSYQMMLKGFNDAWGAVRPKDLGLSYPADKPVKRIDYIFLRRNDGWRVKKAWVVKSMASDHLPVVAEVELRN